MMYVNRFHSVLHHVEVELAASFPVFNPGKEIVFFYSTTPVDEETFKFGAVFHAFERDTARGEIKEIPILEVVPRELLDTLNGSMVVPKVWDDDAVSAVEIYDSCYEDFISFAYSGNVSQNQKETIEKMFSAFKKLVPASPLRDVYCAIGRQMFEYIGDVLGTGRGSI